MPVQASMLKNQNYILINARFIKNSLGSERFQKFSTDF